MHAIENWQKEPFQEAENGDFSQKYFLWKLS